MGIFNFFRKRKEADEQERLQKAAEARSAYQARKRMIVSFLESEYNRRAAERSKQYKSAKRRVERENGKCPKCGSANVVNVIKRAKGEVHGSGSASFSFNTFTGGGSGYARIDGEMDTYPVNKCNDCGNEWNVSKAEYPSDMDPFSTYDSCSPMDLCSRTAEYLNIKWDPSDIREEFDSMEAKKADFLKRTRSKHGFDDYRKAPRYALEYAAEEYMVRSRYDDEVLEVFKPKPDDDKYSYTFPDDVWEAVKLVIGWVGPES